MRRMCTQFITSVDIWWEFVSNVDETSHFTGIMMSNDSAADPQIGETIHIYFVYVFTDWRLTALSFDRG